MNFKAGDFIIFSTDGSFVDLFIMLFSKKTHVGMFINETEFIEASNPGGVRIRSFDPKWSNVKIYRPPEAVSFEAIQDAVQLALFHVGEKYSIIQGVIAGLFRMIGLTAISDVVDNNWNCSEFGGYLIRYGMRIPFMMGAALRFLMPSDLEDWMVADKWQTIQ